MVLAGAALMGIVGSDFDEPIYRFRPQFAEDETVHQLLSSAISHRPQLEHMTEHRLAMAETGFQPHIFECGILQPDADKFDRGPLTFHDAVTRSSMPEGSLNVIMKDARPARASP
ncbi:hypothetical protein FQV39_32955 (plasmid) [Bosea sp. F3-2]|uniref:hypothetical protein n=1 Tax=Bosea sp. F3-2 TaxID=2599640 RepID=UPI0011ED3DF7|nr:hypothetical protein [Bosea sp. F3-2]QEL27414.1 hypothetical protein FQV39_32955 [Bosea sp. F3-2]